MTPTATDAAQHLATLSDAVSKALADESALASLPLTLTGLSSDFSARFAIASRPDGRIVAKSDDQQIVYGWASVATINGEPLIDLQKDVIPIAVLQEAVHEFMASRAGDTMHNETEAAEIVDSLVVTKDLATAMGWPTENEGWFVGFQIYDPDVWARVKSGELRAFSIAGDAWSTKIPDGESP